MFLLRGSITALFHAAGYLSTQQAKLDNTCALLNMTAPIRGSVQLLTTVAALVPGRKCRWQAGGCSTFWVGASSGKGAHNGWWSTPHAWRMR